MPDHVAKLLMVPGRVRVVDSCTTPSERSQTAMASLFTHTAPQMAVNDSAVIKVSQLPAPGQAGRCPTITELPRMSRYVTMHLHSRYFPRYFRPAHRPKGEGLSRRLWPS